MKKKDKSPKPEKQRKESSGKSEKPKKDKSKKDKSKKGNKGEETTSAPFEPFVACTIPDKMPESSQLLKLFEETIKDLDVKEDQRKGMLAMPDEGKWGFICGQVSADSKTPTPKWILSELSQNVTVSNLSDLSLFLSRSRISWCNQFLTEKGALTPLFRPSSKTLGS